MRLAETCGVYKEQKSPYYCLLPPASTWSDTYLPYRQTDSISRSSIKVLKEAI